MRALRCFLFVCLLAVAGTGRAQHWFGRKLPGQLVTAQYAGSIGLAAVGYHRMDRKEHLRFGLLYGYLPPSLGGTIHTFTFKFAYTPWHVHFGQRVEWQPVSAGIFVVLALGPGLQVSRPPQVDDGYYWWTENFRQHIHLTSELDVRLSHGSISRLGIWLEANTNDLYVYSWYPNRDALSFGDIVKLGIGVSAYFGQGQADTAVEQRTPK